MQREALFPGSFDPFTLGHKAIVDQGLDMFDRIVIGVGGNISKHGFLTLENRKRLIRDIFRNEERIEIASYNTLTGDFCRERGLRFILRGLRNTVDYEYERNIHMMNRRLYPEITTILLFTPPEYVAISSSMIRELVSFGRNPKELMPANINIQDYI